MLKKVGYGDVRALYIETLIQADLDEVWRRTQDPAEHQRWDLRFTRIEPEPGRPGRFRYTTRLLPGLATDGIGVCAGERWRPDGSSTSALRFWSTHRFSPIASGSGYWRYVPSADGVRFLTGYDYRPRWRAVDLVVRPLMGWATAWSFDRLRLWAERGIAPRRALGHALAELGARATVPLLVSLRAPALGLALAVCAVALPPLPVTPAARRCVRAPRHQMSAPSILHILERL